MLHKLQKNTDWKTKYQATLHDLKARQHQWEQVEALLRMTIKRLAIAGRGFDGRLDCQLRIIQELSCEKKNKNLVSALKTLSDVVASLGNTRSDDRQRRSDPFKLMLELLQNIHFDAEQRGQLKQICSDLLLSVANDDDRDSINAYIQKLAALINENFDAPRTDSNTSQILFRLLDMLTLDQNHAAKLRQTLGEIVNYRDSELQTLADLLNQQLGSDMGDSIDDVMTTLLERLAIVQGVNSSAQDIQTRIHEGIDHEKWPDTLNDIVKSIAESLSKLEREKHELENFIVNVTDQLGEITQVVSEGHEDHQSDHQDTQSLHSMMQEGMGLIQKSFRLTGNLQELKNTISMNIESIRGGVDDFVSRSNQRHETAEERNLKLTRQLSQLEQETQELKAMLDENRTKLMYDALTGVYSRMAYDERLCQELSRWTRYQTSFSYAILDIDHFKRINDNYGHNTGDNALKIIAQKMRDHVRQSDYVFRIGGEEFVILLTNTGITEAALTMEKLRGNLTRSSFHFKGNRVHLTLSAGLTETRAGDSVDSIYERADKALYQAKNTGRNCQVIAE